MSMCPDCSAEKYTNAEGQTVCTDYGLGRFQGSKGMSVCPDCPRGWHQNQVAQSQCATCGKNTLFANKTGSVTCDLCSSGMYTRGGLPETREECILCAAGSYCPGDGNEIPCAPGQHQNFAGRTSCKQCMFGKYHDTEGAVNCKYWKNCGKGFGRIETSFDHIYDINCTECASAGNNQGNDLQWNGADDTSTCSQHNVSCVVGEGLFGHTSSVQGSCKRCPTNWFSSQ